MKRTQHQKILQLLKERKYKGIHSYERIDLHILQLMTRIFELKKMGHDIRTRQSDKNAGVIYYLGKYEPKKVNRDINFSVFDYENCKSKSK